jgi:polyisoprenoid-binding protein YceI
MNKLNFKHLTIGILIFLFAVTATAQNVYKLNEKNSKLSVTGTSSLDDWEMEATGFSAETGLKLADGSVSEIQYIKFSAPVAKLESGKNIMDNKANDALQEKKFSQIKFILKGDKPLAWSGKNTSLNGMLTIAGKTKEIKVPMDFNIVSDRQFKASGKVRLKMSDFGIEPPTAIFGTLKTDDEVEVKFDFEFNRAN